MSTELKEIWVYDFIIDGDTVKNWTTFDPVEAFAEGCYNQRRYVPESVATKDTTNE